MNVAILGFGSIGKRHVNNLLQLGVIPYVVTGYPDRNIEAHFLSSVDELKNVPIVTHAVICLPTGSHLEAVSKLAEIGVRNFLVEKPLEKNIKRASSILKIAGEKELKVYTAYNMRYLPCFQIIRDFVKENLPSIRIVNITAGQYLPEWRPERDYRKSYSADEEKGGGVSLDLSHEIDYMLWIFGKPSEKSVFKSRIGSLEIKSDDIFCGSYKYNFQNNCFISNVQLDYLRRPRERYLRIMCENGKMLYCDFVNKKLERLCYHSPSVPPIMMDSFFDLDRTYIDEMCEFLSMSEVREVKLSTLEESIEVLELLEGSQDV